MYIMYILKVLWLIPRACVTASVRYYPIYRFNANYMSIYAMNKGKF